MRVCFVELFKTPLDAKFTNVYDSYNDMQEYFDFLEGNFDYKRVLEDGNDRSIIEMDNGARIVLPYEYSDVRDYNYLLISNDANVYDDEWNYSTTKWSYWFVVAGRSLNDSYGTGKSPACELTIIPDCFTNNELGIYGRMKTLCSISNRHLENCHITVQSSEEPTKYTSNGFTVNSEIPTQKREELTTKILWLRVRTTFDENFYKLTDGTSELITNMRDATSVPSQGGSVVFYIPYGVYSASDNLLHITKNNYMIAYQGGISVQTDLASLNPLSPYILEIEATYVPPFEVISFSYDTDTLNVNYYKGDVDIVRQETTDQGVRKVFITGFGRVHRYTTHSIRIDIPDISEEDLPDAESVTLSDNLIAEFGMNTFPYNYKSVKIADTIIDLISSKNVKYWLIEFDNADRTALRYRIAPDFELEHFQIPSKFPWHYCPVGFKLPFSTSSMEYFNATSNASVTSSSALKGIAGAVSVGAGVASANPVLAIGGVVSIAGAIAGFASKRADADNAPDRASIPSIIATNNLEYLDMPTVITTTIDETYLKEIVYQSIHKYGYEYNAGGYVEENYRSYFDYVKCSNISLPLITNSYDKEQIENAYLRGLTRWHLNASNDETILARMNFDVANLEQILI